MPSLFDRIQLKLLRKPLHKFRADHRFDPSAGSLTDKEYEGLEKCVTEAAGLDGPIIEIGTLVGATTMRIALWSGDKPIITVDNYQWNAWEFSPEEHYRITAHSLDYLVMKGKVELKSMDKNEFYQVYDGPTPSMVFLDAVHDYPETKKDIAWAKAVGAQIICGHDYSEDFKGVIKAVEEAGGASEHHGSFWRL